ncbi:hypothetical protein [Synergistes jonesii]|uniref:hypothetical protein n=1 Tax=Synergistes jonesii TaxID=2754 RepID=UPI00248E546A|nr:hypothetical protein [Synergistes jonesii]
MFFSGKQIELLLKVLNSEYAAYYFFNTVATLDNGGFQMRQQYVEEIPIPARIQTINDSSDVFKAFSFTPQEINFIKESIKQRKMEILKNRES